jgi:phosphatidylglycerol lysyltransferase
MVHHSIGENLEMPGALSAIQIKPKGRLRRAVGIVLPPIFLLLAAWMLHRELSDYRIRDVVDELSVLSSQQVALACTYAILAYLALAGYDWLALLHVRHPLPLTEVASTAFISYALSYNLGYGLAMGGSVRYRLYGAWELTSANAATVVAFCVLTFWVGLAAIAGIICLHEAATITNALRLPSIWIRPLDVLLMLIVVRYLVWSAVQRPPLRICGCEVSLPPCYS